LLATPPVKAAGAKGVGTAVVGLAAARAVVMGTAVMAPAAVLLQSNELMRLCAFEAIIWRGSRIGKAHSTMCYE
jgi:hypothetical protein